MNWQEELSSTIDAGLKFREPMSGHTSFRIGGPADVFAEVGNMDHLEKLVSFCSSRSIPLLIIGRGTNFLVSDKGIRGVVVRLCGDFAQVKFHKADGGISQCRFASITAGAAVALSRLSRLTAQRGLAGLEFAFGIPGSLGGALVMNAGAGSHSIGKIVDAVEVIAYVGECSCTPRSNREFVEGGSVPALKVRLIHKDELRFGYRWSNLSEYICVTKAHLRMRSNSPEETVKRMKMIFQKKKAEQPLSAASAGCVFKNPKGMSAGRLIDECGLKGARVGDAQVSTQHANFIVNTGGATAADVLNLVDKVRATVKESIGIDLELELKVVGYND